MEEDLIKEETKKDNILIIVGIIMLIIIAVVIVFYTLNKNNDKKPNGNTITISDDISTTQDDTQIDKNTEKKGNTMYIYAKGYADMAPIAFTYECKSENCNIYTAEKGIILYDENNVLYRELTQYEYDQIYNQEVSPVGEKLDTNGFELVSPKIRISPDEIPELKNDINIYEIENIRYVESNNLFTNFDNYKGATIKIIEDKIIINSYIYDYQKHQVINVCPSTIIENIKKVGSFYILEYSYHDTAYSIFDEKLDTNIASISSVTNSYYIKDDILYYVDDGIITVVDKNNKKIEYDSSNITAVNISENKLLYLDKDNNINIRNLDTNEEFYNSDIKVPRYSKYTFMDIRHFVKVDNGYWIIYRDYSVVDNSGWESYIRKTYSTEVDLDEMITTMKSCRKNIDECKESAYYFTGYIIEIDKNGQFVSKNYYIGQ